MGRTSVRSGLLRRLRQRIGPMLDQFTRAIGQPTTHVYPAGYVGTVPLPIEEFELELRDGGFNWDPLSMYHYTLEGNATDGSWAYRSSRLANRQLHVVLFTQGPAVTEVYAHDEFNWLRHPFKHAREVDIRRSEGSKEMRRWLNVRGIAYERDILPVRRVRHIVKRVRRRADERLSLH